MFGEVVRHLKLPLLPKYTPQRNTGARASEISRVLYVNRTRSNNIFIAEIKGLFINVKYCLKHKSYISLKKGVSHLGILETASFSCTSAVLDSITATSPVNRYVQAKSPFNWYFFAVVCQFFSLSMVLTYLF